MASGNPLVGTPFESPVMPTPDASGTLAGLTGGYDMGEGSQKETSNASDLPLRVDQVGGLQDAPTAGTPIGMPGGVASPMTPAGNIDRKSSSPR